MKKKKSSHKKNKRENPDFMKEKHWFSLAELQNSKPLPMCSTWGFMACSGETEPRRDLLSSAARGGAKLGLCSLSQAFIAEL